MSNEQALNILEKMTDKEFGDFTNKLPNRVQLLLKLTNWREVLPAWYIKLN